MKIYAPPGNFALIINHLLDVVIIIIVWIRYEGSQRTSHRPAPPTFSTGSEVETMVEGGEVEFVRRIISDSLTLRTQIRFGPMGFAQYCQMCNFNSLQSANFVGRLLKQYQLMKFPPSKTFPISR